MNKILESVKAIGYTPASLCVLKGIRAKIELSRKQPHRLGSHFASLKGVVLTGRAGAGKTHIMRQVYNGLSLAKNSAIWVEGGATTAGRREKLKENAHSIIFWNEIACNDLQDVRLLKQITEGCISYIKYGELDETAFTGLLIGSTNDFAAKGKVGRDLEALRDRMDIVDVGPPDGYNPKLAIETEEHYYNKRAKEVDWELIAERLSVDSDTLLSSTELAKVRPFWLNKLRECLDGRILTRAGKDFVDCFVFAKRFFGELNDKTFEVAVKLADASVSLSSIPIADISITQRDIINIIYNADDKTTTSKIIQQGLEERGRFISRQWMHRNLNRLVEKGYIVKIGHGSYSLLKPRKLKMVSSKIDEKLKELGRPSRLHE